MSAVAAFALKVAEHRVKIILLIVFWDLLHGWQPLRCWPGERNRHLDRSRGRLHKSGTDQCREEGTAVGFGSVAAVQGAVFGGL